MFHSRKLSKLNRLQERALRIVHNDKCSTFYQLFQKDKSVTIHNRNFQYLATEIFNVKIGISPPAYDRDFKFCENAIYNFRSDQVLGRRHNIT